MSNKFVTFLQHIGHDINVGIKDVLAVTNKYHGFIDLGLSAIPGVGGLARVAFDSTIAAVTVAEKGFAGVSGSGSQKLAQVVQVVGGFLDNYIKSAGSKMTAEEYINLIVSLLNAFPAPDAAASPVALAQADGHPGSPARP